MRNDMKYGNDRRLEQEVNTFLSSNWDYIRPDNCVFIDDQELQFSGVDLSCADGKLIDLKIKNLFDINNIFQWPSVEILINNGNNYGWFVNPKSKTTTYIYLSLFSRNTKSYSLEASQIDKIWMMAFSKRRLVEYIQRIAPIDQIVDDARELARSFDDRKNYYIDGKKAFWLKKSSPDKGRQVVNLVMHMDNWNKVAKSCFLVKKASKNNIEKVNIYAVANIISS